MKRYFALAMLLICFLFFSCDFIVQRPDLENRIFGEVISASYYPSGIGGLSELAYTITIRVQKAYTNGPGAVQEISFTFSDDYPVSGSESHFSLFYNEGFSLDDAYCFISASGSGMYLEEGMLPPYTYSTMGLVRQSYQLSTLNTNQVIDVPLASGDYTIVVRLTKEF